MLTAAVWKGENGFMCVRVGVMAGCGRGWAIWETVCGGVLLLLLLWWCWWFWCGWWGDVVVVGVVGSRVVPKSWYAQTN